MFSIKKLSSWLLVAVAIGGGALFTTQGAVAQTSNLDPLEGLGTDDDGADLFGESSNPYELIHRAILAPSMSSEEFQERQNQAISGEAQDFRLRQQELIRQQGLEADEAITIDGEAL